MTLAEALIVLQDPRSLGRDEAMRVVVRWCDQRVRSYLVGLFGTDMADTEMIEQATVHLEIKAATQSPSSRFRGSTEGEAVRWCQTVVRNEATSWWRRHHRDHRSARLAGEARSGESIASSNAIDGRTDSDPGPAKVDLEQAVQWLLAQVAMRVADGFISMQTGPEIGVASTKAFTAPIVDQYMLAILLADLRGTLDEATRRALVADLRLVPDLAGRTLAREAEVEKLAQTFKDMRGCLYLGRGINMPIAYEGALKLKEISYIHAEGYAAGEMKHGPIALIDEEMPVLCLTPKDPWHEKMISQIQQAKARGGTVIAVATDGDELVASMADHVLWIPETPWMLSPVVTVLPLQLLAYHIAAIRGLDVDQPRNLAKSVTVE